MYNKNAIRIQVKRKMRMVQREVNKKTGNAQIVWREGGCIYKREDLKKKDDSK